MKNKGITLLALIVTVIIMLILATVTIRLITSGGIINKAREASIETLYQADKEELTIALAGAIADDIEKGKEFTFKEEEGSLEKSTTQKTLDELQKNNMEWKLSEDGTTFTSPIKNVFVIGENGKIKSSDEEEKPEYPKDIVGEIADWITDCRNEEDKTIRIIGCNLKDLKDIIVPKYLVDDEGNKYTVTALGDTKHQIANFSGTLILPSNVIINMCAFEKCIDLEKIVFGDKTHIGDVDNKGIHWFNSSNVKLKEVVFGKECEIIPKNNLLDGFYECPNIEKVYIGNGCNLETRCFYSCTIKTIEGGNNVILGRRTFHHCIVENIAMGDYLNLDFAFESATVNNCVIGDRVINANFATQGSNPFVTGKITLEGRIINNLSYFGLYKCNLNVLNKDKTLTIANENTNNIMQIVQGALAGTIGNFTKIIIDGRVGEINFNPGNWQCISTSTVDIELYGNITSKDGYGPIMCEGGHSLTIKENSNIGEYVLARSIIDNLIIEKNVTISSTKGKIGKIIIKNKDEWDVDKLLAIVEWAGGEGKVTFEK